MEAVLLGFYAALTTFIAAAGYGVDNPGPMGAVM